MKLTKYIAAGMAALTAISCNLDETPYGIYSKENMFSTEEGAQSVLLSAYRASSPWEYSNLIYYIYDMTTDVAFNNRMDDLPYPEITEWNVNAIQGNEWNLLHYKTLYRSINSACDVIENVPGASFTQEAKDRILGEAYFLRGYAYYQLAVLYGRVPMKLTTTESYPALAASVDVVWGQAIADLETAQGLLKIQRNTGCADKVAAWSALAKAYLFIASAVENGVPGYTASGFAVADSYSKAASWAKLVVDNPEQTIYYLDERLDNIFDPDVQDGPEHIFLIAHHREGSSVEGDYTKTPRYFLPGNDGSAFYVFNPRSGQNEITTDGWSICVPTAKLISDMRTSSATDRRLELFRDEYYTRNSDGSFTTIPMSPQSATKYTYTVKHIDFAAGDSERTSCPTYIFRFSDIVLVYAEALGRSEGVQWLNKLTGRSDGRQYTAGEFADDKSFRAAVLQERAFELCFEAKRLEDLRRTNNVRTLVNGKVCFGRAATDLSAVTDEQLTYFPLPQREIDLNPNL